MTPPSPGIIIRTHVQDSLLVAVLTWQVTDHLTSFSCSQCRSTSAVCELSAGNFRQGLLSQAMPIVLCECIRVCTCVCMYVCMYARVCLCVYVCVCMHACVLCMCVCAHTRACMQSPRYPHPDY